MPEVKAILIQFGIEHAWYLALGVVSLVLSRRSQVDAWAEKHPRIAGVMKALRALGLDPWMLVQSLSLIVRGKLPSESAKPPPAAVLLLFLGLSPALTSCASALPSDQAIDNATAAVADAKAAIAEAEAKAVEMAKKAAEAKTKAIKTARDTIALVTAARALALSVGALPPDIEAQTGVALGYASDVLAKVERGEQVAREELLSAVDAVAGVVGSLRKLGREIAPLVDSSLGLARAAIEGA